MGQTRKKFFGIPKDLYICLIYNPPTLSSYTRNLDKDILECVEKDISHYNSLGNVILCGDINARVSSEQDFILQDNNSFIPLYQNYPNDKQITFRKSKDPKLDSRGKDLLDLCIGQQIRLLNN